MKLFSKASDGGKGSGVTGYFLVEIKSLFSIVLLHFSEGSREAFHSHAFNAWTYWLRGYVVERVFARAGARHFEAGEWKYTPRELMHKVEGGHGGAWAISFRGPWSSYWREFRDGKHIILTHGRKEI